MPIIELQSITKTYGVGDNSVHALRETSFEIHQGSFTAIMGTSGSGKSTLLNILGMLDRPSSGCYRLEDTDVASLSDNRQSEVRGKRIGIIFQSFNLFPNYNVLENVCIPMRYSGTPKSLMKPKAEELLCRVGLQDRMHHKPSQLSGGQCQRVAIARSLANTPALILADEPTGNLDEKTGNEVLDLFHGLVAEGRTIVMVTHNPAYGNVVERVIQLHDGKVVSQ
jgi:putative ABC transport system ATP-binding protein